jgi:hypothetical protein
MKVFAGKPKQHWRMSFRKVGKTLMVNKIRR